MSEGWWQPVECLEEQEVLGCRGEPAVAADDVADPHLVVVDREGQVVGWKTVGFQQNVVVQGVVSKADGPHHQVLQGGRAFDWHRLTYHVPLARRGATLRLFHGDAAAAAVV